MMTYSFNIGFCFNDELVYKIMHPFHINTVEIVDQLMGYFLNVGVVFQ